MLSSHAAASTIKISGENVMQGLYKILSASRMYHFNTTKQLAYFIHRDYMSILVKNDDPFKKAQISVNGVILEMSVRKFWVDLCLKHRKYHADPIIMKEHARLLANKFVNEYVEIQPIKEESGCQFCTPLGKCLFCSGQLERPI